MKPCWPVYTLDKLVLELAGYLDRNGKTYTVRLYSATAKSYLWKSKFAYVGGHQKALVLKKTYENYINLREWLNIVLAVLNKVLLQCILIFRYTLQCFPDSRY